MTRALTSSAQLAWLMEMRLDLLSVDKHNRSVPLWVTSDHLTTWQRRWSADLKPQDDWTASSKIIVWFKDYNKNLEFWDSFFFTYGRKELRRNTNVFDQQRQCFAQSTKQCAVHWWNDSLEDGKMRLRANDSTSKLSFGPLFLKLVWKQFVG